MRFIPSFNFHLFGIIFKFHCFGYLFSMSSIWDILLNFPCLGYSFQILLASHIIFILRELFSRHTALTLSDTEGGLKQTTGFWKCYHAKMSGRNSTNFCDFSQRCMDNHMKKKCGPKTFLFAPERSPIFILTPWKKYDNKIASDPNFFFL